MKLNTSIKVLIALGAGLSLSSCVDPYYAGGPQRSSTVVTTEYRPGYTVRSLPSGYREETVGGTRYYYHNNVYYRPSGRGYVVVQQPRGGYDNRGRDDHDRRGPYDGSYGRRTNPDYGRQTNVTVIRQLPRGASVVEVRGQRYYRSGNSYYQSRADGYVVVRSPY